MINTPRTDKKRSGKREPDKHVWLDKQCLEPITKFTGCSRLCNACLWVLQRSVSHKSGKNTRHVQYWATLSSSADRGCHLCTHLRNHWETNMGNHRATEHILSHALANEVENGRAVFFYRGKNPSRRVRPKSIKFDFLNPACESPLTYNLIQMVPKYSTLPAGPVKNIDDHSKCSVSTSSPECQRLARSWLMHCMKSHAHCRPDTEHSKKIPARLIEINLTNHTPTLRIIETNGQLPENKEYMTLSYCWGNSQFLTLHTKDEQQLKLGFIFEKMPKVFQDAIHIAGWFQINYLWIDSLCILQDSQDDWISESCKMKNIYRGSFLTIAATGATDPYKGCFRDRNPSLVEPIKFCVSKKTSEYRTIFDRNEMKRAIDDSPLSKRAWALQERLLSTRVLHFGENQMVWECNEMSACESCPGGTQPIVRPFLSSVDECRLITGHKDFLQTVWSPIVELYSTGGLTKFSDKCFALSGIADKAQSLFGGTYIAGLWRENFEVQLLWYIHPSRNNVLMAASYKRPTTYVAPSWSWLSVDGPISLELREIPHIFLEVINIETALSNNNPFGTIKSGRIQARGWLSAGTWKHDEARTHEGKLRSIGGHLSNLAGSVTMDTALEAENVVYLPVGSDKGGNEGGNEGLVYGLVLAQTGDKDDEYRRIGIFRLNKYGIGREEGGRRLFKRKRRDGKWRTRPKTIFTIV